MSHKLWIVERTMVLLLLLLTIGLGPVAPDKLTGTEIAPTAAFSGGTLEDLKLPLESFDNIVKEVKERKYKGYKEFSDEVITHVVQNRGTIDIQPLEEDTIEENQPNTTLSIEFKKYVRNKLNTSQNVAEDKNPYRLKVNSGKSIIVLPQNNSRTEFSPVQNKSHNINKFGNLTSSTTNITRKPDINYSYVFSKGVSSLRFDRHKPTTTRPNFYRISRIRTKSKNTNDTIKRRNPLLNKIDANSKTLSRQNVINEAKFSHKFRTSNGIHREEIGTANDGVKVEGSYSYVGDDGKTYSVRYSADENGFRPEGDHIPFRHEVVRKVTEQDGVYDDGSYDEAKYGHLNYENIFVRRAYKQGLRRNIRRRIHTFNQEVNNANEVGNDIKSHSFLNPKLNSLNSSMKQNSDETKLNSTESNTDLESNKNGKQTYTIKRRPRKFSIDNGFNKLYVANPKSTDIQHDLKIYAMNNKELNEFSKTFATVGYIYGTPINKFSAEEQRFNKNKAKLKDNTIFFLDKTSLNNEKTKYVKTNETDVEPSVNKNINPNSRTIDNFDKKNNPHIITKPYAFVNKDSKLISNVISGEMDHTVTKTEFRIPNDQQTHLLHILEIMKPLPNITDQILLLRKLFGVPNATKIEDFKTSVVSRPIENVNGFKSLFSTSKPIVTMDILSKTRSPYLVVNEDILNKTTVMNVEEVLKNIFGTGENDKDSNIHNNIDKEVTQLNETDKNSYSPNIVNDIINKTDEKIDKLDNKIFLTKN